MSIHVFSLVLKRNLNVGGSAKAVALKLADCASDDGTGIWAAKGRIAGELEITKRTVQTSLKTLIARGFVHEVGQKPCARGFTIEYAMDLEAIAACPPANEPVKVRGENASPVKMLRPTGENASPLGVKEIHPNHHMEPSEEPSLFSMGKTAEAKPAGSAQEAVAIFNEYADRVEGWPKVAKLTDARRKGLAKRLEDCGGIDGWRAALERAEASDFLRETWGNFTFDKLIEERIFVRLMEGNYDNRTRNQGRTSRTDAASGAAHAAARINRASGSDYFGG